MSIAHPQKIKITPKIKQEMENFRKIQEQILLQKNINPNSEPLTFTDYAKYILKEGSDVEKREIVKVFGSHLYLHDKEVCSAPTR